MGVLLDRSFEALVKMGQICGKEKKPVVQNESRKELDTKGVNNQTDDPVNKPRRITSIVNENVSPQVLVNLNTFENTDTAESPKNEPLVQLWVESPKKGPLVQLWDESPKNEPLWLNTLLNTDTAEESNAKTKVKEEQEKKEESNTKTEVNEGEKKEESNTKTEAKEEQEKDLKVNVAGDPMKESPKNEPLWVDLPVVLVDDGVVENLKKPLRELSSEDSISDEEFIKTPRNSAVEPDLTLINKETSSPGSVDNIDAPESSNDDSVLFFGDGHSDIPSVMVTDLVTKYLDKVEEEDDNIDPSFTVVEKPDVADIANNVI